MVVVVIIATGATLALKAYNALKVSNEVLLEELLFSIQQQAGVMAALCAMVFTVITALKTAKLVPVPAAASSVPSFARAATAAAPSVGAGIIQAAT